MQTSTCQSARVPADSPEDCPDEEDAALFLACRMTPAGIYRLAGTDREALLEQENILPATLDGHIAVYERRPPTWAEMRGRRSERDHCPERAETTGPETGMRK